ncbi:MAG: antibiotic biosynthesis monooxygenase [Maribacter sp.]|nr:MAG: antibiotic biosynthesis monooxygenase [Maribacter sp.]
MRKSYLTIVARILVKEEHREPVKAELVKLLDVTRAEEGNISYDLHQDNDNPNLFLFHERWVNQDFLLKHTQTEHFVQFQKVTEGKLEDFTVHKMTEIGN